MDDALSRGAFPDLYNDNDPKVCAWLRELVRFDLIPKGEVLERSILDIRPSDLAGYRRVHFFCGIGGWPFALRLAGIRDDDPRRIWTGSPPCQPFSAAGKQLGRNDARHLAPHFIRLVGACRPDVLYGEQVASAEVFGPVAKGNRPGFEGTPPRAWLDDLYDRLEAARYAVGSSDLPSAGIGAPHIRQRTFFGAIRLADSDNAGLEGRGRGGERADQCASWPGGVVGGLADTDNEQRHGARHVRTRGRGEPANNGDAGWPDAPAGFWHNPDWIFCRDGKWRPTQSSVQRVVDWLPASMVPSGAFVPASSPLAPTSKAARRVMRLRGYGNAINPHLAAEFIQTFEGAAAAIPKESAA